MNAQRTPELNSTKFPLTYTLLVIKIRSSPWRLLGITKVNFSPPYARSDPQLRLSFARRHSLRSTNISQTPEKSSNHSLWFPITYSSFHSKFRWRREAVSYISYLSTRNVFKSTRRIASYGHHKTENGGWWEFQSEAGDYSPQDWERRPIRTWGRWKAHLIETMWLTCTDPCYVGRYLIYVSYACPFAHRALITRALKGLEDVIDIVVMSPCMGEQGWAFGNVNPYPYAQADPIMNAEYLKDIYLAAQPNYDGRYVIETSSHNDLILTLLSMIGSPYQFYSTGSSRLSSITSLQRSYVSSILRSTSLFHETQRLWTSIPKLFATGSKNPMSGSSLQLTVILCNYLLFLHLTFSL